MSLEVLVYSPLVEDTTPNLAGWSKETIDYITDNKGKIHNSIRGIARGLGKNLLQTADVEDIYSEVLMYCYKYDDYNINKAIERSSTGQIVSLEGYVHNCIKFCVMRYLTKSYEIEKETIRNGIMSDDGKELSIFDTIEDAQSTEVLEDVFYDLETICKYCESIRYRYGVDIYLVWYIRLLTMVEDKGVKAFNNILEILGITKKDIIFVNESTLEDELMFTFAKSISLAGVDKAIEIIEQYIFSCSKIKEAIQEYA